MLTPDQPLAIFMEATLGDPHGKMGYGMLRFSPNPIACVIDSCHAGKTVAEVVDTPRDCPVVASVEDAAAVGARVLVLGIAPSGGLLPAAWRAALDRGIALGMCLVNGLHDRLSEQYSGLRPGQWVWDIRREPNGIGIGKARARLLDNCRVAMLGTDMCTGKMTAGLMLQRVAERRGIPSAFLATGQIGIAITGRGIPLDAVRLDYACGAVEKLVLDAADAELAIIEGQGSILHPGSTATLPLLRGACPTHLILTHRAGVETLRDFDWIRYPPLRQVAILYEDIAEACASLPRPRTAAIALNTGHLDDAAAHDHVRRTEDETGLPTTDVLRFGAEKLLDALELE